MTHIKHATCNYNIWSKNTYTYPIYSPLGWLLFQWHTPSPQLFNECNNYWVNWPAACCHHGTHSSHQSCILPGLGSRIDHWINTQSIVERKISLWQRFCMPEILGGKWSKFILAFECLSRFWTKHATTHILYSSYVQNLKKVHLLHPETLHSSRNTTE